MGAAAAPVRDLRGDGVRIRISGAGQADDGGRDKYEDDNA